MNGYTESDAKVQTRWNARKQRDDLLIAQANHTACLLAESMRDCDNCKFQPDVEPWNVIPDSDTVSEIVTVTNDESITCDLTAHAGPRWILSRSWADKHLNSDDDLQYFKGGAVIK